MRFQTRNLILSCIAFLALERTPFRWTSFGALSAYPTATEIESLPNKSSNVAIPIHK